MDKQIETAFKYHAPTDDKIHYYQEIRGQAKRTAELINLRCPNSREKSLAITKLEESVMWANAAIARND